MLAPASFSSMISTSITQPAGSPFGRVEASTLNSTGANGLTDCQTVALQPFTARQIQRFLVRSMTRTRRGVFP